MRAPRLAAAALAAAGFAGCSVETLVNRVGHAPPVEVSAAARSVHRGATVVDLHADSLLWERDLARRSQAGHADLPRLRRGGVALELFTIVTRVPASPFGGDERWPDLVTLLALLQGPRTLARASLFDRALYQIEKLERLAAEDPRLMVVRTRRDLDELDARRRNDPRWLGALIGLEGAHALGEDPDAFDRLVERGVRSIGIVHLFDNRFGGSSTGLERRGLTEAGRRLVRRAEEAGVLIDLAHASPATVRDVLAEIRTPPLVSHTGVRATCDRPRNLADDEIRAIAAAGGVIGIGFWTGAVCGDDARAIARAVRHVVELVGDDVPALGSDFDGAVTAPFDATGLPQVTAALLEMGLPEGSVRKILGENALRLLRRALPPGEPLAGPTAHSSRNRSLASAEATRHASRRPNQR